MHIALLSGCLLVFTFAYGAEETQMRGKDINLPDEFMDSIFRHPLHYKHFLENFFESKVAHLAPDRNFSNPNSYINIINFTFEDILHCFITMASNHTTSVKNFEIQGHGEQWKLIKRVVQEDGEYWTATFKNSSLSYENTMRAIYQGGYSLYIIGLHRKLKKIETLAKYIQSMLPDQKYKIGINLYLTPHGKKQAFEAHMDYMDGLILQVAGCKRWRVYDPMSYPEYLQGVIPVKGNMIKPEQNKIALMTFKEFELRKGGVLYVPRGTLHEAATNCTVTGEEEIDLKDKSVKPHEPSVHLTIGIEDPSLMLDARLDL